MQTWKNPTKKPYMFKGNRQIWIKKYNETWENVKKTSRLAIPIAPVLTPNRASGPKWEKMEKWISAPAKRGKNGRKMGKMAIFDPFSGQFSHFSAFFPLFRSGAKIHFSAFFSDARFGVCTRQSGKRQVDQLGRRFLSVLLTIGLLWDLINGSRAVPCTQAHAQGDTRKSEGACQRRSRGLMQDFEDDTSASSMQSLWPKAVESLRGTGRVAGYIQKRRRKWRSRNV